MDKNGFSSQIEVKNTSIDNIKDYYDLIIANILTDQIIIISDKLVPRLNKNELLILSGIRNKEKRIIIDKFFKLGAIYKLVLTEDGWCSLLFRINNNIPEKL